MKMFDPDETLLRPPIIEIDPTASFSSMSPVEMVIDPDDSLDDDPVLMRMSPDRP